MKKKLKVLTVEEGALFKNFRDLYEEIPLTRDQCISMPRPCPFVSCVHHLYLDVNSDTGAITQNYPGLEVWEIPDTCALDVVDRRIAETLR